MWDRKRGHGRATCGGMMAMEFRLLGMIAASNDGAALDLGPGRQQCVLAALLVNVNQVVSVDQLQARVWGDEPPHSARGTLHSYLSRLRRILGKGAIERRSAGYVLGADPATVDLHRFQQLVAHIPGDDDEQALPLLKEALRLWRGDAFAGLDTPWINGLRDTVESQREAAELDYIDLRLRRGQHGVLLSELAAKAAVRPLDERLAGQLMLAQYRNGRQAEALAHYERIRCLLGEELGVEPGPELRDLHLRVLRHELPAVPEPETRLAPPPDPAPAVPRQLPAASAVFTGRAEEMAELDHDGNASTVVISAIHGMAGVGKTALAVQAAHRLASRYPDGQVFLDLHGFTRDVSPVDPAEALDRILRALGVPDERIPAQLEDRSALLRTTLAGRRVLLVLDNVVDEAQVEPLLPGSPGCMVLITSRGPLAGLDNVQHLSLDVLPLGDSRALFAGITGEDPASEVVAEIVELCGRLPLAIRIAAARLKAHPSWTVSHLADRLRDHGHRLAELDDGPRSVTAAIDLSYRQLTTARQRMFRLLSLHPGLDFDAYAAAALAGTTLHRAGRLLDDLSDAHLVQEPSPGRYRFHDLLRAHAAQTSIAEDSTTNRCAALIRLFDHYTQRSPATVTSGP
jgi:DNA-binding SARP family transcriptional activator